MKNKGLFITFEGGDGAGKSTHLALLKNALIAKGEDVLCIREPGGTLISEQLREIVLDNDNSDMCDECELLIYEAARAQLVSQVIKPALSEGKIILCDRFSDSTLAYQAYGRGLDSSFISLANAFASSGISPDRTIILSINGDTKIGIGRATQDSSADRLESAGDDFHSRVNKGFLDIAAKNPERIRLIDSSGDKLETIKEIFKSLSDLFLWMGDENICSRAYFEDLIDEHE